MDDPGSIMSGSIILYILLVLGCAYFAGTETSLASVNRIHMISEADRGNKKAKRVLYVLDRFDEALSVLLIGNNIFNIGCATLAVVMVTRSFGSGSLYVTMATILTTVIIYIFGEILPKVFARSLNEKFAMYSCGVLIVLMKLLKPLSVLLTAISSFVSKPFKQSEEEKVTMTEDELQDIVNNISEDEDFDAETGKLVKSALAFDDRTAREVMVPMENVLCVTTGMKTEKILDIVKNSSHSRLLVIGRDGSIKGILQIRKFLRAYIKGKHRVVLAAVTDYPYFVRPDIRIDDLLTTMSNHRRNLAVVKDASGDNLGIVTIEDILEELVGEIYDEEDIGGDLDE